MNAPRRLLAACALVALACVSAIPSASAADACAPLQERMSYARFRKLGLDQLSAQQLKGLNAWLAAHGSCGSGMPDATRAPATPPHDTASGVSGGPIHSRIAGDFTGWDKDTVLTLQNGQRWRVTDDTPMHIARLHNPQVTVRKGLFNAWLLGVKGVGQTAHVAPVR